MSKYHVGDACRIWDCIYGQHPATVEALLGKALDGEQLYIIRARHDVKGGIQDCYILGMRESQIMPLEEKIT